MVRAYILAAVFVILVCAPTHAFHEPGASQCAGCHMPSANKPDSAGAISEPGNPHMLKAQTPSDVCLSCHADDLGAVFSANVNNPAPEKGGGNFIYLLEDNLNDMQDIGIGADWIPGDAAGHNINAPEHGLHTDLTISSAPGGDYPAASMSCTSCHDPHGNENFRLLRGAGPIDDGDYTFLNPAPEAEGISLQFGAESNTNHTAYHRGMSEWCANCHGEFHAASDPAIHKHPSGAAIGAAIASAYRAYNGTADPSGGTPSASYLAQVPFEDPLTTTTSTNGPSGTSQVMCLSCHRAHASSAPDAGRWDFNVTYLAEDGKQSGSQALPNPYGAAQRSLCNKCHVRDASDTRLATAAD